MTSPDQDPGRISAIDIDRKDGRSGFTLAIAPMPGRFGDLKCETDGILAWKPDIVIALDDAEDGDTIDGLSIALGTPLVETMDMDDWPIPSDPELLCERREILCHVLAMAADGEGARIMICGDTGAEECTAVAVEMLMIAGATLIEARAIIDQAYPGCLSHMNQSRHFLMIPENTLGDALGLPFSGGYLLTKDVPGAEGSESCYGILRADGFQPLKASRPVSPGELLAASDGPLDRNGLPRMAMDRIPECRVMLSGETDLAILAYLVAAFRLSLVRRLLTDRPSFEGGDGALLHISGFVTEEDYRSLGRQDMQ